MECLVTGAAGFAGSHLCEQLAKDGHSIKGLAMPGEDLGRLNGLKGSMEVWVADITDRTVLRDRLGNAKFDWIFHLAALSSVASSFGAPSLAFRVNTQGTVNLLEIFRQKPPRAFIYISSADVYGLVPASEIPIRETCELKPASPYAASKAAAEIACLTYWRTFALPVVVLRPFNHTGARQGPGFAPSDFASAIARIEKGLDPPKLAVGSLDSYRDYGDVRDVVRAYELAAERCEAGEIYNVSTGNVIKIGDLLEALLSKSNVKIAVTQDPAKSRPSDMPYVKGDSSKFHRRTGWEAKIPFDMTLTELLEWWRQRPS
jgi:GDP-4-dehydro-6-deoxy-D-mannose reductase